MEEQIKRIQKLMQEVEESQKRIQELDGKMLRRTEEHTQNLRNIWK